MPKSAQMSGILLFNFHKWPVRGQRNPARLFERATWIQSSLPRVAQLMTASQVMTFVSITFILVRGDLNTSSNITNRYFRAMFT